MRNTYLTALLLLASGFAAMASAAQAEKAQATSATTDWAAPNWTAGQALARAKSSAADALAGELEHLLREDADGLLSKLAELAEESSASSPEQEAAVLRLTRSLHRLRADAVPAELVDRLAQWKSRVLIEHEESARFAVPLFNIAAEAQGLQNRWRREAAADEAGARLDLGAAAYLEAWSGRLDAPSRAGWLDALRAASNPQRKAVLALSLQQLAETAELAQPAAEAAIALHDNVAMARLLRDAQSGVLRPLLSELAGQLPKQALNDLLVQLIEQGKAERAALAIALWSPALSGDVQFERRLLALLGDPELGGSAALALSQRASTSLRAELRMLADTTADPLLGSRARMALAGIEAAQMERLP